MKTAENFDIDENKGGRVHSLEKQVALLGSQLQQHRLEIDELKKMLTKLQRQQHLERQQSQQHLERQQSQQLKRELMRQQRFRQMVRI